jgi:hypothetical protein
MQPRKYGIYENMSAEYILLHKKLSKLSLGENITLKKKQKLLYTFK